MATVAELEKLLQRKHDLDALKSQFFANVSHELRTPLALILGPVEKLLADSPNLDERERRDLEVVRRNAWLLLRHVNDLLDVSKLDAGKLALRYAAIDLGQLVRRVAGHFETLAPQRNIVYAIDVPEHLAAEVDAEKLERVVLNLLSNAFKFVPVGGQVKLSLHRADERALLAVEDNGPGVPPELRELIFERFAQGDGGTTRQFGGTGLGLAIAKEFVAQHRGTIVVTDGAEGGAMFVVDIPLRAPSGTVLAEARTGEPELAESVVEPLRPVGVPRRIERRDARPIVIVVEDNVEMNRFIQESLEPACSVATAFDGEEGLLQIMAAAPDLIVTDMMMPKVSGEQLMEAVRRRRDLDHVPILVLSAKADDDTRVRLLQRGAQDYLIKPFSAEELRARAGNLIMMNRARRVLQRELDSQQQDLERLADEASTRNRELCAALEAMRQAREAAASASAVKSEFLSLVSHELRTPLMTIQLQLDRIDRANPPSKADGGDAKQHAQMQKLRLSAQRLLELVDSLLEYTRLDSNRIEIRPQRFCLPTLVDEAMDEMRPRAERKQIELRVRTDLAPTFVSDPRLIRLILLNLVDNAIKFTEQGAVELVVESQTDRIELTVTDSGRGIPDEQQRMIFEPWGRVETVREKHTPGVGLGLTLVKRMTESLGGTIELRSKLGEGSAFRLRIPEAPAALAGESA